MRTLHSSVIVGLLALSVSAQTTHLVGPGGFPQIRDALAVAVSGDIVNVQPGTYAHFEATVGVTIRAVTIGTVLVEYDPAFAAGCTPGISCGLTRIAPPVGQVVHCIGLDFRPNVVGFSPSHRVVVASGTVTFDRCALRAQNANALSVDGARVHLQGCTLAGVGTGGAAIALAASNNAAVTAVRCSFTGSSSASLPGAAVRLRSAELQGSQLQLLGGAQLFGGPGATALDLDAPSAAWISDSSLTAGGGPTCPVVGSGTGRIDRCVLVPTGTCTSLPAALVVGIDSTTPLQNGAPFTVDWRTDPNQLIAVFASPGLGYVPLPGITDQPLGIDPANFWLATAVVSDATGFATFTWNMPAGQFLDASLFVLGAGLAPTSLALSPPVGGVIR